MKFFGLLFSSRTGAFFAHSLEKKCHRFTNSLYILKVLLSDNTVFLAWSMLFLLSFLYFMSFNLGLRLIILKTFHSQINDDMHVPLWKKIFFVTLFDSILTFYKHVTEVNHNIVWYS